jgi:hypothetical protein
LGGLAALCDSIWLVCTTCRKQLIFGVVIFAMGIGCVLGYVGCASAEAIFPLL